MKLFQNYPTPFNPSTTIRFQIDHPGIVTLTIVDILGRVGEIVAQGIYPAGSHQVLWNSSGISSGVYFARLVVRDVQGKVLFNAMRGLLPAK